ncbi:MAG: RNase adapter RapZ [Polyangiaceae bacterium]|nr:RNase adapter RapZ [Polyangiaceae bacterium]
MSDAPTLVLVVTGLSGAGKTTTVNALEDLGFFCVDNLPPPVIERTLDACVAAGMQRIALGIDVRARGFLEGVNEILARLAKGPDYRLLVLFLDSSDEALLRRFGSTRRPHPLSTSAGPGKEHEAAAVVDGIRLEREQLAALRAQASLVIDTTGLHIHQLRRRILENFGGEADGLPRMRTRLLSFGFKYSAPVDADLMFDVRFLDNPYFVDALREHPGTTAAVRDYVLSSGDAAEYIQRMEDLLEFCLPRFQREGKSYLTIGIGCTGGRHRSVVIAEELARRLSEKTRLTIEVIHRDIRREAPYEPDLLGEGLKGGGM